MPDSLPTLSWDEGDSAGPFPATRHPQFYEVDYKPHDAAGPSYNKLCPGHPGPLPLSPAPPHPWPAARAEGRAMRLRGAGGCGRASLRRRPRPRGPHPVRPRARCGSLLPLWSRVFVCGGVRGETRVGAASPSARSLPGRVGASPRRPPSPPPPREDAGHPHRAGHAAPARRRRSHMPEPQPCEQAAPAPRPAAPGPVFGALPPPGPGAVAPA